MKNVIKITILSLALLATSGASADAYQDIARGLVVSLGRAPSVLEAIAEESGFQCFAPNAQASVRCIQGEEPNVVVLMGIGAPKLESIAASFQDARVCPAAVVSIAGRRGKPDTFIDGVALWLLPSGAKLGVGISGGVCTIAAF